MNKHKKTSAKKKNSKSAPVMNETLNANQIQIKSDKLTNKIHNETVTIIPSTTIDKILNTNFKFKQEEYKGFDHVRAALVTANALSSAIKKAKNEIEALRKIGSTISLALNDNGVFCSKESDEDSENLFHESSEVLRELEHVLAFETERLNRALKVERFLDIITNALCEYSGICERSLPIVEIVQKTGLNYQDVVESLESLKQATGNRNDLPNDYTSIFDGAFSTLAAV